MDVLSIILLAICLQATAAKNRYQDHGIVMTGIPYTRENYRHLIAFPTTPQDLVNYTGDPAGLGLELSDLYIACEVDYSMNYIYLYDMNARSIVLGENFNSSLREESMTFTTQHSGVAEEYIKLAVDWISHNIYWTDPMLGWIIMQKGGPINDQTLWNVIVHENVRRPRGIAVDSVSGYLFWTDIAEKPSINRASLTGQNVVQLHTTFLSRPNAITADSVSKYIYWADDQVIHWSNYEGADRHHLQRYTYASYFDLAVFGDIIMATDIDEFYLRLYDKKTGEKVMADKSSGTEGYIGLTMYHSQNQYIPPDRETACRDFGCQDICVNEPTKTTCLCRMGYQLNPDMKTCIQMEGKHLRGIVLTTKQKICIIDIRILSDHHDYVPTCFYEGPSSENITWVDLNMRTREVYFATDYTISSVKIDGNVNQTRKQLLTVNSKITGLTYDWVNEDLYYSTNHTSTGEESVWLYDLTTSQSLMIQDQTSGMIRGLLVVPFENRLFWIAGEKTIEYADLGVSQGSKKSITLEDDPLFAPSHMYHDASEEKLYVVDVGYFEYHYLSTILYNGTQTDRITLDNTVLDIAKYNYYALYVEPAKSGNGTMLRSTDIRTDVTEDSGKIEGLTHIIGIKVLDVDRLQKSYPSPCGSTKKNGGCDQVCIPKSGSEATCACEPGFQLQSDGKACKSTPVEDNFILVSDRTFDAIKMISLPGPGTLYGIQAPSAGNPGGVIYNHITQEIVYANAEMDEIWTTTINGSSHRLLLDVGYNNFASPDMMVLDPSTGNIYYSGVSYYNDIFYDSFIAVLDPKGRDTVVVFDGHYPRDIAIHPKKGRMYWTDHGDEPGIYVADMDGSNMKQLIVEDITWPNGLVIDYKEERLYWTDGFTDKIFSCDLNGRDRKQVYEDKDSHMMGLGMLNDFLYYTAWDNNHVTKIHKSNRDIVPEKIGPEIGLGRLHDIFVYSSTVTPQEVPISDVCAKDNGGCSHFCLPTPSGRTCGCETYYDLLPDSRTCENAPRCPASLSSATFDGTDTCLRLKGDKCKFTCQKFYSPKPGLTEISCVENAAGELEWSDNRPCIETLCPPTFINGFFNASCSRKVGSTCLEYTCSSGYEKNSDVTKGASCLTTGLWSVDGGLPLCVSRCPMPNLAAHHLEVQPSCKRSPQEVCRVFCDTNYRSDTREITCNQFGQWSKDIAAICQEIKCPEYDMGASVGSDCSRKVGVTCQASCIKGYQPVDNTAKITITCTQDGTWDTQPCQMPECPSYVNGGVVDKKCSRIFSSRCDVTCFDGYTLRASTPQVECMKDGTWNLEPCERSYVVTAQEKSTGSVAAGVGAGIGVAILFVIIAVIILVFIIKRRGGIPFAKSSPPSSQSTSFENPRYVDNSVNIEAAPVGSGRQSNNDFNYATLDEDTIDLTKDSWTKTQQEAAGQGLDPVYDNTMQPGASKH